MLEEQHTDKNILWKSKWNGKCGKGRKKRNLNCDKGNKVRKLVLPHFVQNLISGMINTHNQIWKAKCIKFPSNDVRSKNLK